MGCGSSSQVVPEHEMSNGHAKPMDNDGVMIRDHEDDDDLPTVLLTDTPVQPKAPIAFEIPIEELDITRKDPPSTPPPQIQRLLQPPQADITLPDIEEKLAIAEARRQTLLLQRAASAQKRTSKMLRAINGMQRVDSEQDSATDIENQADDTFDMDKRKPNSRPPTVDLGKRSTFPPSSLPRASKDEELSYDDSKRTSMESKRPSVDSKMSCVDDKRPSMDSSKLPAMDCKVPAMDGKMPAMDGKMPAMEGKMPAIERKRSSMDSRPSMDATRAQMEVKRSMNELSGVEQRRQSNERKDLKTPQTIERKNSTDIRRMR